MLKGKVSKILCIMLSLMLVIGMAPANSSYAASRGLGNTISSWFNSIKGNSNNKGSSSTDKVTNTTTTLDSTTQSDSSGSVDDIKLTKNATDKGTDKDGNQLFDIALGVKGKKVTQGAPLDITLVVDLSNSMTSNSSQSLAITKEAAKEFIGTVLPASGTSNVRLSIVAYGTMGHAYNFDNKSWNLYGATKSSGYYTSSREYALEVINNKNFEPSKLSPTSSQVDDKGDYKSYESGGTNTEAGFRTAKAVTKTRNRSEATSVVVFMTDGVPTYRCNGTGVSGNGSSTGDEDFNQAVTAANELKNAGNDIYTVGLLTGYRNPSNNLTMANKLLSDDASYNIGYITEQNSTKGYQNIGPAYSTKYYPITESAGAGDKIKEIYTNIANQILVLATGTVVDKIPEGFELTSESKTELVDAGYIVSEDGKTITFEGIPAGEEVKELTFTVKYTGVKYGSAYTNTEATYSGTLYDGTTFNKPFVKPVVGLNPKTENDDYYVNINEETPLDILVNDPSFNKKITDDGYTVSDFKIEIVENPANAEATVNGENVDFTANTAGDYTFTYKVTATATAPDNYKGEGKSSYTLVSKVTTVTVHCINAPNKAYVIDFGKAVTFNDTFNDYEKTSTITLGNGSGTYGNLSLNGNGDSITYKLNKFMNGIDDFEFNENYSRGDENTKSYTKIVSMVPASSIYYEDNFSDENGKTVITYDDVWTTVSKNELGDTITDIMGDGNTGYDTNYNKDDSKLSYSAGSIHMVTAPSDKTVKASFEFTGTGVDIYSLTNGHTGKIQVAIWKQKEDGTYPSTAVYRKTIDTKYNSGTAYQLPVVNFDSEEDAAAKYKVQITVAKGNTYYLDAVRIYNPVGNLEKYDSESGCKYVSIRNQSLSPSIFTVKGNVFIDSYLDKDADVITLDSNISEEDLNIYKNYGRKTEVIIAPDQEVSIKLNKSYGLVQLGARIDALAPNSVSGGDANGSVTANGSPIGINSSTDMYYTISSMDNGLINIKNNTSKLISITKLKLK